MPKRTLKDSHIHKGQVYGPGTDVEVPDDFPKDLRGLDAGERSAGAAPLASADEGTGGDETPTTRGTFGQGEPAAPARATGDEYGHANTAMDTVTTPDAPPATTRPTASAGTLVARGGGQADTGRYGSPTGGATGLSADALADMSKDELAALAEERGVTVTREDGRDDLAPTKADYQRALSGGTGAASPSSGE